MSRKQYEYVTSAMRRYENQIKDTSGNFVNDITMFEYPDQMRTAIINDTKIITNHKITVIRAIITHLFHSLPQPTWNRLKVPYESLAKELNKTQL